MGPLKAYLEAVSWKGTVWVNGLVHVGEEQGEEDEESEHAEHHPEHHFKWPENVKKNI